MAINCDTALERCLEADPAELAGRGDSELATHVQECPRCRAVGEKLLAGQEELASALSEARPRTDVSAALIAVSERRRKARRWERSWRWGPVAAAAAIAAVLILQALPTGRFAEGELASAPAVIEPLVEASAGQNVMVFETRDQSAKVIWLY
jgi:anti-sigma-K factor RskA